MKERMTISTLKDCILQSLYQASEIGEAIHQVLALVGQYFDVDRAYIFENSEDDTYCNNTFEWCNEGITPEMDQLQHLRYEEDLGGVLMDCYNADGLFFCPSVQDLPEVLRNILEPQSIVSMLHCAIREAGAFKGYIGFDDCGRHKKGWEHNPEAVDTLIYTSRLLSISLLEHRHHTRIQEKTRQKMVVKEHTMALQMNREVQEAYTMFGDLLANVTCGLVICQMPDTGGKVLQFINDGFCKLVGGSWDEVMAAFDANHLFCVAPEDRETARKTFYQVAEGSPVGDYTFHAQTLSGAATYLQARPSATRKADGSVTVYLTIFDVSEAIQVRDRLKQSQDTMKAACDFAGIGVGNYWIAENTLQSLDNLHADFKLPPLLPNFPQSLLEMGLIQPESVSTYRHGVLSVKRGKQKAEFECRIRFRNGSLHWLRVRLNRIKDNPDVAIYTSQVIDNERELRAQNEIERKKQLIRDESLLRYLVVNLSKNKVMEYKELEAIPPILPTGVTLEKAMAQSATTIAFEGCKANYIKAHRLQDILDDYARGITKRGVLFHRKNARGQIIWQRDDQNILRDPESGDLILYEYCYDVHHQEMFEETLQAAVQYDYDRFGSLLLDSGQITILYNPREQQKNYFVVEDYSKMIRKFCDTVVVPEDRPLYMGKMALDAARAQLARRPSLELVYHTLENGQIRTKRTRLVVYDTKNRIALLTRTDITVMANQEKRKREELALALKQAKQGTHAKTDFLSRMSHDLRTTMNGILGLAALSESEDDPRVLKAYIKKIKASGEYLLGLINDTLDFQKIESGKMVLQPHSILAMDLVDNVVSMMRPAAAEKNVTLKIHANNTNLRRIVRVDARRLKQIFMNLLSNAIKFTPSGGQISLSFACLNRTEKTACEQIIVKDTGTGMGPAFLKDGIFKPFSQEHRPGVDNDGGTGLGLSIVKNIVELMGGTITVKSTPDVGTTFTVTLTCDIVGEEEQESASQTRDQTRENSYEKLEGKHILLAEDHPLNAEIAMKLLEKKGCLVTWARDGRDCLDRFVHAQPFFYDAILMDIRMPKMDGLMAATAIRHLNRKDADQVPIIAMTANAFEKDRDQSIEAGMNGHLSKPVDPKVLYATIARVL
ncbi:MAG: ATP-binding protein [Eubacteriaceae bacterium]|nr:ATP-binding protein [Eubacteriaceae bacterium]